ncbi:MAG: hypothetical protein ACRCWR_09675 [Saezia sp.]
MADEQYELELEKAERLLGAASKSKWINVQCQLLDLAIKWEAQADIYDKKGDADCGTGSDVPYAMANILREHARAIEAIRQLPELP